MRHMQAGLAVPDFPLVFGQVFPSLSPDALAQYNQQLIQSYGRLAADEPITASQILIQVMHRYWAVIVSGMIIWTSIRLIRLSSVSKKLSRFAYMLLGLLVIQILLGAFTVLSQKAVDITTAHVATGALLLVCSTLLTLHAVKIFGIQTAAGGQKSHVMAATREATA